MNRLKELRKQANKTQKDLSELLGVSEMTISRWENEKELSIKHEYAQQLADYFGVGVGYLLGYDDDKTLLDTLANKMADLSPEEFIEYAKTTEYKKHYELFEYLFYKNEELLEKNIRGREIREIHGLLKGLDIDDLLIVNSIVKRLYFSKYSLKEDQELDNYRLNLQKELELNIEE